MTPSIPYSDLVGFAAAPHQLNVAETLATDV